LKDPDEEIETLRNHKEKGLSERELIIPIFFSGLRTKKSLLILAFCLIILFFLINLDLIRNFLKL
jgi:hypothetical protein